MEEVEDEDDAVQTTPKKKKKKPKKKKKATGATSPEPGEEAETAAPPGSPTPPAAKKPAPAKSPASNLAAQMSNISLLPVEQTAPQSARSYLKAENLLDPKVKVKSRSEASLAAVPETEKKSGFMSKFLGAKEKKPKRPRNTWFSKLTKKSKDLMHQLLRTSEDHTKGSASMKWEHFLKVEIC